MAESKLRRLAAELRDADDEITENHIHFDLPPGAKVEADATGRLRAISVPDDERVTPTDPPRAKPDSTPPRSGFVGVVQAGGGVVVRVVQAVNNPYALGALFLLVAALFVYLRFR